MLDDLSANESLHRSSELVNGHWWRTFGFTALVDTLAILSGPLLGVGLLLVTDHSLTFINFAASLVSTFTVPFAAIQLTLYYFDLEARRRRRRGRCGCSGSINARPPGPRPARVVGRPV